MLRYLTLFVAISVWAEDNAYQAAIAKWRRQKETDLKADGGWLTVTGLFWLKEGRNRVDSGVFELHGGKAVYHGDDGREFRLEPVIEEGETDLFFIFRDRTAGKETYGAGRFLYAAPPRDGKIELDFNKAYNPPCAFTPYATCPLPPKQNILPVRIEAGERATKH